MDKHTKIKEKKVNLVKIISLGAGPVLFLILYNFFDQPEGLKESATAVIALAAWMIVWWITDAVPLPVTALLPLVFFPVLQVFDMTTAAAPYANPIIFLFMGGFIIALAMEKRNLHTRIALNLIRMTGTHANGIILGFMLATAFLSMWISNTATTVMMLPIALSVIDLLKEQNKGKGNYKKFALCLMLSIAYAANIGGTTTIIGTPPNVVFVGYMKEILNQEITFGKWLLIGIPFCLIMLAAVFFIITKVLFPHKMGKMEGSSTLIKNKLLELGTMSRAESLVAVIFFLTAFFWMFQQNINNLLAGNYLNNTVIAMAGGVLMFIIPVSLKKPEFILNWKSTERLPWGILLLFGGGLCLAKGMEETGIIQFAGNKIAENTAINPFFLTIVLTVFALLLTEIMSNVALTVIFLPVVLGIAESLQVEPLYLAIPVTLAASCAFMMPVSTPPNAVVFSSGYIKINEMVKAGIILNIIAVMLLVLLSFTILRWVY